MSRLTFLYQMDLPHRAVAVYTYLYDRANKNGECWPSVNKIAGDIKLSPATARKATIDLKKAVLFETTPNATAKKVARAACYLSQITINSAKNSFADILFILVAKMLLKKQV